MKWNKEQHILDTQENKCKYSQIQNKTSRKYGQNKETKLTINKDSLEERDKTKA